MKKLYLIASAILLVSASTVWALSDKAKASMEERISPWGDVCEQGDNCGTAAAGGGGSQSPEEIYNTYCLACHTTGAAGAPMIGNAGQWESRVAKGMDTLYANAINGIGAMPAKGLCTSCSDEDIEVTVDYILENSQ